MGTTGAVALSSLLTESGLTLTLELPALCDFFVRGGVPLVLGKDGGTVNAGGNAGTFERAGMFRTGGTIGLPRVGRAEFDRCAASPSRDNAGDLDTLPEVWSDWGICMGNDMFDSAGEADRAVRWL